jgi:dienelactone hydrolase
MRPRLAQSIAVALLATPLLFLPAAAETVHFPSATTPPTPLQQRLFQERGHPIASRPSTELVGDLYRPEGAGPFPAVVSLHGCGGRDSQTIQDAAGARFTALGYILLTVDSFGPRGVKQRCNVASGPTVDRVADAYGALLYLATLPFVDADRVALLGYSAGAMVTLSAVELGGVEILFDRHFHTAIAYYPGCSEENFSVPTLILIGELDDWTPSRLCRDMVARRSSEGAPLKLVVYPDTYHAFNYPRTKPVTSFGHHIEYNEAAARAAWEETVGALRAAFGR